MVIVFDGVCNFCNGWVRFLLERDRDERLRYATASSSAGSAILTEIGEAPPEVVDPLADGAPTRFEDLLPKPTKTEAAR